jgi:hypothetical protein
MGDVFGHARCNSFLTMIANLFSPLELGACALKNRIFRKQPRFRPRHKDISRPPAFIPPSRSTAGSESPLQSTVLAVISSFSCGMSTGFRTRRSCRTGRRQSPLLPLKPKLPKLALVYSANFGGFIPSVSCNRSSEKSCSPRMGHRTAITGRGQIGVSGGCPANQYS